jgi:hypothetical protein
MLPDIVDDGGIDKRIQRIYASLGVLVEVDMDSTIRFVREGSTARLTFDKDMTLGEVENNAHALIALVAHAPDHLRKWAKANEVDAAAINAFIDASDELKLLIDLANIEKHGGFGRDGGRSGRLPVLQNLSRGMRLRPNPDGGKTTATVRIEIPEGQATARMTALPGGAPLQVVIDADVNDSNGDKICRLAWLLESGVAQVENLYIFLKALRSQS